ncbi:MAG: hypothetical protein CL931_04175 [Deltaproteobacteria bacterium]|nr:hypothetical protein [Deltaproteobacteria bacterium]
MNHSSRIALMLAAVWVGLVFAVRDVLALFPSSRGSAPLEAFLFDTDAVIPALHVALATLVLFLRRGALTEAALGERSGTRLLPLAVSSLGLLVLWWAHRSGQADLQIDALLVLTAAAALWIGGTKLLGQCILPIALLALARPWPPMLAHHVHEGLQTMTGDAVTAILSTFGEVERSGHLMSWDGRLFEVIEGCSGLKIEISLLSATLVYAAFLSRSRQQTLGLVALALVLAPVINVARVLVIMTDSSATIGEDHTSQGLVAISLGVVLLAVIDHFLESSLWPPPEGEETTAQPTLSPSPTSDVGSIVGVACTTILAIAMGFVVPPPSHSEKLEGWALHEIRPVMGDWKRVGSRTVEPTFFGSVKFQSRLFWEFEHRDGTRALVFAAIDNRRRRDYSGYSPKTRSLDRTWEIVEHERVHLDELDVESDRALMRAKEAWWEVLHYRIAERPLLMASFDWLLARDLWRGTPASDLVVVRLAVSTDGPRNPRARRALADLQREVSAALRRAAPEGARARLGWPQ